MNIKRPFVPAFLNRFDNVLLLKKPSKWAARTHLVIYYSLIFIAALSAIYIAVPDDTRSVSTVHVWVGFLSIICIIALVVWLIYLLRFNVFKRFGIIKPVSTLIDFLLYFLATSVIVSFCFIPIAIETVKANRKYKSDELANDMNNINLKICLLEYDSLPKKWRNDTLRVQDTLPNSKKSDAPVYYDYDDEVTLATDTVYTPFIRQYRLIDTANLTGMIRNGDSLNRVNDSTYVLSICPDYTFLEVWNISAHSIKKLFTSEHLFNLAIRQYSVPDRAKVKRELKQLLDKYYYAGNERYNDYNNGLKPYKEKIKDFYKLQNIEDSIDHITERKYRWFNYGTEFFMFWFYFSFLITLLLFAFRHTTARVFFLSILSIVIIFILTMLLMVFLQSRGSGFHLCVIFYFILFTVISATTFGDHKRKAVKGIAINLFVFMLPFIPLVITGLYYQWLKNQHDSLVSTNLLINYETMSLHYLLAQIAGPVIFLVLLVVYVHQLYRRWYGLPEE